MKEIKEILAIFSKSNYECYVVGGFVRDFLLGIASQDIDLTTNAPLSFIEENFEVANDYGKPYGNLMCKYKNIKFEITKFRIDLEYNEKRQPTVKFINDLETDLKRRDFTINSICLDENFNIIDLYNGKKDLDNKIIKCIGNPMQKFKEDPLRIYRMFRFAITYNLTIDEATLEGAYANALFLNQLNRNILWKELKIIINSLEEQNLPTYQLMQTWIGWLPIVNIENINNKDEHLKKIKTTLAKEK